ncbi:hypothetical protein H4219_002489 [Mycoemilia scoparia]|uniref:Proteasome assembly chaperone 1 n=1 Tax=Mycoemilia scoparia TaxID=417184 RepID=A0A9W8A6S4_9FUNG|nr:hypothetical protein H4219_002489 [Mycoemilia scoparia]
MNLKMPNMSPIIVIALPDEHPVLVVPYDSDDEYGPTNAFDNQQTKTTPTTTTTDKPSQTFTYRLTTPDALKDVVLLSVVSTIQELRGTNNEVSCAWKYAGAIIASDTSSSLLSQPANVANVKSATHAVKNPAITRIFLHQSDPTLALVIVHPKLPVNLQFNLIKTLFSLANPQRVLVVGDNRTGILPNDPESLYLSSVSAAVLNYCDAHNILAKFNYAVNIFGISELNIDDINNTLFEQTTDISLKKLDSSVVDSEDVPNNMYI